MVEASSQPLFDPTERKIVRSAFELSERPVRALMTPRDKVEWLDVSEPHDRLLERLRHGDHSRFPLVRGGLGYVVGIVRARDVLAHLIGGHKGDLEQLASPALYVDEGTDILDLLQQFKSSPVHFAIVVSKQGTIRGIATPMDVLEAMVGHMPSGDLHPS
jgi:putative hemolysin